MCGRKDNGYFSTPTVELEQWNEAGPATQKTTRVTPPVSLPSEYGHGKPHLFVARKIAHVKSNQLDIKVSLSVPYGHTQYAVQVRGERGVMDILGQPYISITNVKYHIYLVLSPQCNTLSVLL